MVQVTQRGEGVLVFESLAAARRCGYEVETRFTDSTGTGYIVSKMIGGLRARAIVRLGGAS